MARLFLSFTLALATATLILFGAGATPASAQPATPDTAHGNRPARRSIPRRKRPSTCCSTSAIIAAAIKKLEEASRKYPELPSAHVLMYNILAQVNQAERRPLELEEAVKNTPSDPEP